MKHRFAWSAVLVVLAMVLASCGGAGTAAPSDNTGAAAPGANTGAATGEQVVITRDSAGKSVDVKVGQPVLVKLGEDHTWKVNVTPSFVIDKDPSATLNAGEQGLYLPKMNGRATLQATGEPVCLKDNPPCTDPQVQFNVTLIITQP